MSRIIIICALAGILAVPVKALDGTPLPPNTVPTFKATPLDLPPNLLAQAPNPALGVDPLIGSWKLNLERSTSTVPAPKNSDPNLFGGGTKSHRTPSKV